MLHLVPEPGHRTFMRLLFVAFAISLGALLWVAFSVARRVLRHKPHGSAAMEAHIEAPQRPATEAKVDASIARPRSHP